VLDPEPIVSQSCEVALSMLQFERSGKSFEVYSPNLNYIKLFYYFEKSLTTNYFLCSTFSRKLL
jgi:hypothetical protein